MINKEREGVLRESKERVVNNGASKTYLWMYEENARPKWIK